MSLLLDRPELLVGYRHGERPALEAIYREYVSQVATLIRRGFVQSRPRVATVAGVRDPERQCDLIQETFMRAFSEGARRGYDGISPFRPYVLRIAKNLMIDGLRGSGREISERDMAGPAGAIDIETLLDGNEPFPPENPGELAHFNAQQEACAVFIDTLSAIGRQFFELRYRQDLSQREVAERMGVTRRKVRTLESRLRRGLKRHLKTSGLWP